MEEKKVIVMDEDGTIIESEETEVNVKEETMMERLLTL